MSTHYLQAPDPASDHEMTDNDRLSEGASDISYTTSNRDSDFVPWEEVTELQLLHEATLQDLLKARNGAFRQVLEERNALLRERSELVGHAIEFSEFDFLESPEPLRPYMISPWGHILEFRGQTELWARNPKEIKPVHVGTQTDDADTTLIDIELETSDKGSDNDSSKNEGN